MEITRVSNPRANLSTMDIFYLFKAFDTLRHVGIDLAKLKSSSSVEKPMQSNVNQ